MARRRRINISVSQEEYELLAAIRDECGFRSVCTLARAMLRLLPRYIEAGRERHRRQGTNEIQDMFDEMGDWERTPFNTEPPARHRRKKDDGKG